jgi:hypothetical protein
LIFCGSLKGNPIDKQLLPDTMNKNFNYKFRMKYTAPINWFCYLILFILFACKSDDKKSVSVKDPDSVQFRLSPDFNKTYRYEMLNESEMTQEVNEEKIENNSTLEMNIAYSFSKDTLSDFLVKMLYNKFKLSFKLMDAEKQLDASTASSSIEPSERMFAAFDHASLNAVADTVGNIKMINGFQTIKDKMAQYAGDDKEANQMLNGSIQQYVNESFFKQTLEQNFKFVTTRPLKVGDTISQSTPVNAGFNFNMSVIYTLTSIEDNIAGIRATANIDMKDEPLVIEGTNVIASMKGSQTGTIKINFRTGLLQKSNSDLKIKGTLQIMGREVPFKLLNKNQVILSE